MIVKVNETNEFRYNKLFAEATELLNNGEVIGDIRTYFKNLNAIIEAAETAGEDWQYYAMLPLDEEPFYVNANTRKIIIPTSMKQIGVVGDNYAEIVFFKIARYFDAVDFGSSSVTATIEWQKTSGNRNSGVSAAWVKNLSLDLEGDVLIGWPISEEMTEEAGNIEFSLRLTQTDPDNPNTLYYSFSTEPATATIGKSLHIYQSGDAVEITGDNSIILRRIKNTLAADDSFGIIEPPVWEVDISDLNNAFKYIDDTYYLDLDVNGELTVTLDANLVSGNDQGNATYTWQYDDGANWQTLTGTTSTSETNSGNIQTFNEVGHYRCVVEDVVKSSPRSRTYSKEFYILGPETPVVTVSTSGDYISKYLTTDGESVELTVLPGLDNDYIADNYEAVANTSITHEWYTSEGLNTDKGEAISTGMTYSALIEGFYFGNAVATRNKESKKSEGFTTYRVTKPAANPLLAQYKVDGLSDNTGLRGILIKENGNVVSAETIEIIFTDDFKYDRIEYQWYHKRNVEDTVYNKLTSSLASGITAERKIVFTPDEYGFYQVRIIVYRNNDSTIVDTNEETRWDNAWILPRSSEVLPTSIQITNAV